MIWFSGQFHVGTGGRLTTQRNSRSRDSGRYDILMEDGLWTIKCQ